MDGMGKNLLMLW